MSFQSFEGAVTCVDFNSNDSDVAAGSYNGEIKQWDLVNKKCILSVMHHKNEVSSIAYSPSGKELVSCSKEESVVVVINAQTGKEIRRLSHVVDVANQVAYSLDEKFILTKGRNQYNIWDAKSGSKVIQQ